MHVTLTVSNPDQSQLVSKAIQPFLNDSNVFCFHGDLGAGKTTFIKSICENLGVTSDTSSPTYSIVNEYESNAGKKILHFDLYRLNSPQELYDIGWIDYLNEANLMLIEWPEMGGDLIPEEAVHVHIVQQENEERIISITNEK